MAETARTVDLYAEDENGNPVKVHPETRMSQIVDMKVKLAINPSTGGLRVIVED